MQLETLNKLYLELSQFVTVKTEKELELESRVMNETTANILKVMSFDHEKGGWGKISSGLTQDFERDQHSFTVRFDDGTEHCITFSITQL